MISAIAAPLISAGGSLLGSLASSIFGSSAQDRANETNIRIAQENRDWQSSENALNRQWQERMWNLENQYNTPSAMKQRLEQAGYNPYALFDAQGSLKGGSVGTPSMVGAPNAPTVLPSNPMAGLGYLGQSIGLGLQAKQVNAESANQTAQAQATIIKALSQAYQELGKKGFYALSKSIMPYMMSVNPDESFWSSKLRSEIYNLDMDSLNKELSYNLSKEYSPQQIQTGIQEANYRISEIVGRLNTMRISNDVMIKKLANETIVAAAQAFKLKKEGDYFVANESTVNALRKYLVESAKNSSLLSANDVSLSNLNKDIILDPDNVLKRKQAYGIDLDIQSDRTHRYIREIEEGLGNVIHVGYSKGDFNSSSLVEGTTHSYNNNTSNLRSYNVNDSYIHKLDD